MYALDQYYQIKSKIASLKEMLESNIIKQKDLEKDIVVLNESLKVVKLSKHYKIESRKKFILDVINQALLIVFDSRYKIDIVAEEKSTNKFNIKYKLVLYKDGKDVSSNNELYETSGGGILTIISFILKILLGYINSKNKFFILDEVFSQISKEYRSGVAKLLRILSNKYGFTFLIISHDGLEQEDVDLVYLAKSVTCKDGFNKLELIKEYEKNSEYKNYYEVDVENFQAIKKLSMIIKGVTVIHGSTDSGKSAIQRSIRSVVTNSFNVNLYPRWRKQRSKLTTKIRITKVTNDSKEFVELEYKDKIIYRTHTGEEYVGKKLASSNISSLLESFGFVQMPKENIDKLTGDIKQQTQRIFITTQFDKLYLSEDRNGLEKIFSIIFDSQVFNELESAIKNDINSKERELKTIFQQITELQTNITQSSIEGFKIFIQVLESLQESKRQLNSIVQSTEYYENKRKNYEEIIQNYKQIQLVEVYQTRTKELQIISNNIVKVSSRLDKYKNLIQLLKFKRNIIEYKSNKKEFDNIQKSFDNLKIRKDLTTTLILDCKLKQYNITKAKHKSVTELIDKMSVKKELIQQLINQLKIYQMINKIIELRETQVGSKDIIIKLINQINIMINLLKYQNKLDQLQIIKAQNLKYSQELDKLSDKYHLERCSCCNGIGYTLK